MISTASPYVSGIVWAGLLLAGSAAAAQTTPAPVPIPNATAPKPGVKMLDGQKVYRFVEKMPVYLNGGLEGLQTYIIGHVTGGATSGSRAYVTFVIDRAGNVRNPAFGGGSAEDAAAVEPVLASAFAGIGKFRPGSQNGKPVNVELTVALVRRPKK
ncbi:hypothetical protein J0X19_24295 [Hymenobacter sp. BT186]|uniref:TonB C-terminal domain-containing protein n=1 Tax=Hymenobacter telluris TaxID=2816474 RepID=A0A939F2F0_9BACT|nr:hypothetical protein [Hymenobacter telluris]MBO0361102.1 hypothetical protein [Hymenobacter telluris]MBW3377130.1 hypothetical protein [Hymenobacter norwichensis]